MASAKTTLIRASQWVNRLGAIPLLGTVPILRIASGAATKRIRVPQGIRWEVEHADGVRVEWLNPPDAAPDAALLCLHGGGGVLGLYNSGRNMIGHLALSCRMRTLAVDYRLAPEYPFPAGLGDCVTIYRWLLTEGFRPERIFIAGDSMGGAMALATLLTIRDVGQPLPRGAVCISPNTDLTFSGKSMRFNAPRDALLSPQFARTVASLYVDGHNPCDPYVSPLMADLHGLPPILIQVGSDEILLDDSRRFRDCAVAAGVDVSLQVWSHMWHDWHLCAPGLPEANEAIGQIARFVCAHI